MSSTVDYLRSLAAIRDRCQQVFNLGINDKLEFVEWHPENEVAVVNYCKAIIQRDFGSDYAKIPPHGRRNHFISTNPRIDRIADLFSLPGFPTDPIQQTKALVDLYLVSVLLDAGAGNVWTYEEYGAGGKATGYKGGRSEGLAIASYSMFVQGLFSSDPNKPFQVNADALLALTPQIMAKHLQVSETNPMDGLEGRSSLLVQLGNALNAKPQVFTSGRPGDCLEYLTSITGQSTGKVTIPIELLWQSLLASTSPIWPTRLTLDGEALGDVWPCRSLANALASSGQERKEGDDLVPFHKLSQWLCYSLIQPMEAVAGWKVEGWEKLMTGLPEYRNGGLLVDLGLLKLRPNVLELSAYPNGPNGLPKLKPDHPAIIEWRAMTVICLDRVAVAIRKDLGITNPDELTLAQVLEAATWKGGREIAKEKRGSSGGGPPIEIESDGTVF